MRRITQTLLLFLTALSAPVTTWAQSFLGYEHSLYAGIVGASYNPASLADNPYSMDILIVGLDVEAANNYVGVKRKDFRNPAFGTQNLYLRERNTKKAVFFRNEILLPGIMFSNEKYGWGIDMKVRTYANVDGVEQPLAHILATGFQDASDYNVHRVNRHIGMNTLSWFELGGTYARTMWKGAEHYVSIGVRPKFLLGLAAGYAFINTAGYEFFNDTTLALYEADAEFGHSDHFAFDENLQPSYRFKFNPGFGLDIGIIYEHRPEAMQKDKKDKPRPWPGFRDRPAYKYRLGASITDLGIIRFRSGAFTDHYSMSASAWDIGGDALDYTSPGALYSNFTLNNHGQQEGQPFWMRLPLALNLFGDYNVGNNFYVNAQSYTALYLRGTNFKKVHELTRISVTPRWETRWFGVWAPVSFTRMGTVSLGTGVRLGPLVIGTTDILNLAFRGKTIYNADIYFALKVPFFPVGGSKTKKGKLKKGGSVDECPD